MRRGPLLTAVFLMLCGAGAAFYLLAAPEPVTWYGGLLDGVRDLQKAFARALGSGVRALGDPESETGFLALAGVGFVYGVFHAVGPGHGKAVITTYAMANETSLRRVAALALGSALVQGLTAILLVGGAALMMTGGLRAFASDAETLLERVSYAAVAGVGLYLALRGARPLIAQWRRRRARTTLPAARSEAGLPAEPEADADFEEPAVCAHRHLPTPDEMARVSNWRQAATIALAVGVRPCSGAVLVLVLAFALGFALSGVAAVLAMSLGTGLTVAALAVGAQVIRRPLIDLLALGPVAAGTVVAGVALAGGLTVAAIGLSLLAATFGGPAHPFA